MTPNLDDATALTTDAELDGNATPDEVEWQAQMTNDWSIGPVPNGGYTSALIVNALVRHTGIARPSSLTTHYYRPTIADAPATIRTTVLRRGRTTTHVDAVLEQDGKVRARSVAVMADYASNDVRLALAPPVITAAEQCEIRDPASQGLNMTLMESLEIRLDLDVSASSAGGAQFDGWLRFRDERANDALAMALFVDSFPPAILSVEEGIGWVPTVELTTHIRAQAAPGWIQGQIRTDTVRGGQMVEDVRLWDSTGTLVAQARQLALLLDG